MDRRTKILGVLFALSVGYVLFTKVAYPHWVAPLLTIKERIAVRGKELEKLEQKQDEVNKAKEDIALFARRVGSFDVGKVENTLRERLNQLVAKHRLEDWSVVPSRATPDNKTGLSRMLVSLSATGSLEAAVGFMEDVAELPDLVRLGNPSISPAGSSRREAVRDRLNLRMPIEVLIVPETSVLGRIAKEEELVQPDSRIRHKGLDYNTICMRDLFSEPKPPPPPPKPEPVRVVERPKEEPKPPPPPPPPPPIDPRWPDRQFMQLCMALGRSDETKRLVEVMLHNGRSNENKYYKLGDDFNGGKLVYVHSRGAVANIEGEYYVYPIGMKLDQEIAAREAGNFPELQAAADRIRQANPPPPPVLEATHPLTTADPEPVLGVAATDMMGPPLDGAESSLSTLAGPPAPVEADSPAQPARVEAQPGKPATNQPPSGTNRGKTTGRGNDGSRNQRKPPAAPGRATNPAKQPAAQPGSPKEESPRSEPPPPE